MCGEECDPQRHRQRCIGIELEQEAAEGGRQLLGGRGQLEEHYQILRQRKQ